MSRFDPFVAGLILGMLTGLLIAYNFDSTQDYLSAIKECQQDLPRNQECEIFAKPKETTN